MFKEIQLQPLCTALNQVRNVFIYINYKEGKVKLYYDLPIDCPVNYYYLGNVDDVLASFDLDFEDNLKFWLNFNNPKETFDFIFNNKRYTVSKTKLYSKILNNELTPEFKQFVTVQLNNIYFIYREYCISRFVRDIYIECLNTP